MEIVDKAIEVAALLFKASRKTPVYFSLKSHTFMTEGNFTYAYCYNTRYKEFVFIKCEFGDGTIKFTDTKKQIPAAKLNTFQGLVSIERGVGQKFFNVSYEKEDLHNG